MAEFRVRMLADSVSPDGSRLTTMEATFPQMVLRDMTRHRALSFSFESTRAVPVKKRIEQARENPYVPWFMRVAKGMGGGEQPSDDEQRFAQQKWKAMAARAADDAEELLDFSKEHVGRALEPYTWITGIISATDWDNFFNLRCPPLGEEPDPKWPPQMELQIIAYMMRTAMFWSEPNELDWDEWHLPLVKNEERAEYSEAFLARASAGRCATVSYDRHRLDESAEDSLARWEHKLAPFSHWSPGEHPAQVCRHKMRWGNFHGFKQLRKFYENEAVALPYDKL